MAYESVHPASPFRQRVVEALPEVLKPLKYCEFRTSNEGVCDTFACAVVLEMSLCFHHTNIIVAELQKEVTLDGS